MNTNFGKAHGGIGIDNLSPTLASLIPDPTTSLTDAAGATIQASEALAIRSGTKAVNVLYLGANVVDDDPLAVGADSFKFDVINTTTAATCTGINNTTDPVVMGLNQAATIPVKEGDLLAIGTEIVKIIDLISQTSFLIARGRCGTTIATHANGQTVSQSDAATDAAIIPIGVITTLTPAAAGPAFAAEFNNALSGIYRATSRASTEWANFTAYSVQAGAQVLLVANNPGVNITAVTEDFANSTDNVWLSATFVGGVDPAVARVETVSRAVTAAEELVGQMYFAFPFTVRSVMVQVRVTATGAPVAFDGQIVPGYSETTTEVLPGSVVALLNSFVSSTAYHVPLASTMTVTITAFE